MYLILDFVTKALVTNLGTAFRLRCCLHSQSMCTQTEPTNVTQNMFGRIKMKIPWHIYFSLKKEKTAQAVTTTPHMNQGKEPLWYRVP